MNELRRPWRHLRLRHRREQGSLPLALLFTTVVVALGATLAPVVLSQVGDTRFTIQRTRALHAAQTGMELAVAAIRAAYGTGGQGDRTRLPCGPFTGTGGADAGASYRVELTYFDENPTLATAKSVNCTEARKVDKPMPRFARLLATGTTTSGRQSRRAIRGDYPLRVVPSPVPTATWGPEYDDSYVHPREIMAWSAQGTTAYCLDPAYSEPPAGTVLRIQLCDNDSHPTNTYKQNWYYRPDLTLAPVGSIMAGNAMCIDAGKTPVAGQVVTMQPCEKKSIAGQRWYHTNYYNYELATKGSGPDDWALSGLCLNVENPGVAGSRLVLGTGATCRSTTYNSRQTFGTSPKVGPGEASARRLDCTAAAGYPCVNTQLVNHSQPSRCLDRYQTFVATMECVQDPSYTNLRWTQRWWLPAAADGAAPTTGPLVAVDAGGVKYCLTAAASDIPSLLTCNPASPQANQKFKVYRNTGNEFTMYRIVDSSGRCLTYPNGSDPIDEDYYLFYWKAIWNWKPRLDSCVDSKNDPRYNEAYGYAGIVRRQKWDAPFLLPTPTPTPTPTPSPYPAQTFPLINVTEVPPT